jgi:hypothetical protein
MTVKLRLPMFVMLVLIVTACAGPHTTVAPADLPFHHKDPRGLDLSWRLLHGDDEVRVDGLVTAFSATPVREALLQIRGFDSRNKVVSWAWDVVYWWNDSGSDHTRPFHMHLRPIGTETRFEVVVALVDYREWGG